MKLLLICYECSPYIGSEWAVGWGRLLGAAKIAQTHVITSEANFRQLARARQEGLIPANVHVHTPPPDERLRRLERKPGVFAYNYKAYNHWQRLAAQQMQALHAKEDFDLVHQVNVCTFREPGYGADLGIPFLWGPVGGSQNFPHRFLTALPPKEALKEGARGLANRLTLRKSRLRRTARRAAKVIAANSTNQRDFRRYFKRDVDLLLETGLHIVQEPDRSRFEQRLADTQEKSAGSPLRLLWSGELHTRKALPVLLRSLAQTDEAICWQLDVLGDGPMKAKWTAEVHRLGLGDRVHFLGRRSFVDAVAEMKSAHLLCFTSLRDTSGNVVLEALAAGVPIVCFDHQGAGDIVNATCGLKIPVTRPREAYLGWSQAIAQLANDPGRLLALSYGATERAKQFLWSKNHDHVNQMYASLSRRHGLRNNEAPAPPARSVATGAEVPTA